MYIYRNYQGFNNIYYLIGLYLPQPNGQTHQKRLKLEKKNINYKIEIIRIDIR